MINHFCPRCKKRLKPGFEEMKGLCRKCRDKENAQGATIL